MFFDYGFNIRQQGIILCNQIAWSSFDILYYAFQIFCQGHCDLMKETLWLVCISILEMELWCLHTISYIWLFLINFSPVITICLLLGLTMLVTFICGNYPKVFSKWSSKSVTCSLAENDVLAPCNHRCFFNNFVDKLKLNTVINKSICFVRVTVYLAHRYMLFR